MRRCAIAFAFFITVNVMCSGLSAQGGGLKGRDEKPTTTDSDRAAGLSSNG